MQMEDKSEFVAHLFACIAFCLWAIWWLAWSLKAFFKGDYQSRPYFTIFEPVVVFLGCLGGSIGQITGAGQSSGHEMVMGHDIVAAYHITIYSFFAFMAICEILDYFELLPPGLAHVTLAAAFFMQSTAFFLHNVMEPALVVRLTHLLLMPPMYGCALFTAAEVYAPSSIIVTLGRIACTFMQGTWAGQIAFFIYGPASMQLSDADPAAHIIIALAFCWHAIVAWIVVVAGYLLGKYLCCRPKRYELLSSVTEVVTSPSASGIQMSTLRKPVSVERSLEKDDRIVVSFAPTTPASALASKSSSNKASSNGPASSKRTKKSPGTKKMAGTTPVRAQIAAPAAVKAAPVSRSTSETDDPFEFLGIATSSDSAGVARRDMHSDDPMDVGQSLLDDWVGPTSSNGVDF